MNEVMNGLVAQPAKVYRWHVTPRLPEMADEFVSGDHIDTTTNDGWLIVYREGRAVAAYSRENIISIVRVEE